jgi:hypothetical protein
MENRSLHPAEQRAHKRFIVSGRAMLETAGRFISGEVVTVSAGGMFVKSATDLPCDIEGAIDFSVSVGGGQFLVVGPGTVVWTRPGEVGIKFLQEPLGIRGLLAWLEREHYPWSSIA